METKQIKAARAKVNALQFGTPEWEVAMQAVRDLVAKHDAAQPAFEYTSIDGDIFAPRR
jgi:hypothetical protein